MPDEKDKAGGGVATDVQKVEDDKLAAIVKGILDKNDQKASDFLSPATVLAVQDQNDGRVFVDVAIDGDSDPNSSHTIMSLLGLKPGIGERVMLIWDRPHTAYVIGSISQTCDPDWVTFSAAGDLTNSESPSWPPPADVVVFEVVGQVSSGSSDTVFEVRVNGTAQNSFTMPSGQGSLVFTEADGANFKMPKNSRVTVAITEPDSASDLSVTIRFCAGDGRLVTGGGGCT